MEVIVGYLEILNPTGQTDDFDGQVIELLRPCESSTRLTAQAQWDARKTEFPGATAQWHYHHHGDSTEPCRVEALT